MRRTLSLLAAAAGLAAVLVPVPTATAAAPAPASVPPSVPGELLVTFDAGTGAAVRSEARRAIAARLEELLVPGAGRRAVELLDLPAGLDAQRAAAVLRALPGVAAAEPNWTYQASDADPRYADGSTWGLYGDTTTPANAWGSGAGEAWGAGATGAGVYVGVLDEGVDISHPDLDDNVWTNPFDPADGVDNDGNGYVDDVNGWDFNGGDNSVYDGPGDDHGTHVAGTIAAERDNGIGVAGVAPGVTIIPAKFLGPTGGTTANAVRAVDYFVDLKRRHRLDIVAINNSWGGGGYSQALADAIARADAAGILMVAAAGNSTSNIDSLASYPASYANPNVVSVAATTSTGGLASFSNWGPIGVDLGAPGAGIVSTVPGGGYSDYSGTSMATPHVTGAVALYAAANPGATAAETKAALLGSAVPTASLLGRTVTGGRLDVGPLVGVPVTNSAPAASFTSACTGLSCTFTDTSSDADGDVLSREWRFGDGSTATTPTATRTYAAAGTYDVTLTVTDDDAAAGTATRTVTVSPPAPAASPISLTLTKRVRSGKTTVVLRWAGATTKKVDIRFNGTLLTRTANDGGHNHGLGTRRGTFRYQVCATGAAPKCSPEVSIVV